MYRLVYTMKFKIQNFTVFVLPTFKKKKRCMMLSGLWSPDVCRCHHITVGEANGLLLAEHCGMNIARPRPLQMAATANSSQKHLLLQTQSVRICGAGYLSELSVSSDGITEEFYLGVQ